MQRLPWYLSGPILAGTFLCLAIAERRRRLRRPVEPGFRRVFRNLSVGAISAGVTIAAHAPVAAAVARRVEENRLGIVQSLSLSLLPSVIVVLLLMDYTYFLWHVALHRAPWLWRLHIAHHADLDLDTTTALRFHFAEVLASIPFTAGQIVIIGVTPSLFSMWQLWFGCCVMFHHSDVRLPAAWERILSRIVMTPRLHGIHHSIVPEEMNSNWSSGLAIWDILHRTQRINVRQRDITIGVPEYRRAADLTLRRVLLMPFKS